MIKQNRLYHLLFLLSPLILLFSFGVVAIFIEDIALVEVIITITRGYALFFIVICSYLYFRRQNSKKESKWDHFISIGYPIGGATFFAWIYLLPLMKNTIGMWDSQFLNMLVTLTLGYFVFFFLVGIYRLVFLFLPSQKVNS